MKYDKHTIIDELKKLKGIALQDDSLNVIKERVVEYMAFHPVTDMQESRLIVAQAPFIKKCIQLFKIMKTVKAMVSMVMIALLVGGSSAAFASEASVPGDALYGVEQLVESIQYGLESNPTDKAHMQIKFAEERVMEMKQIIQQDNFKTKDLMRAQAEFQNNLVQVATIIDQEKSGGNDVTVLVEQLAGSMDEQKKYIQNTFEDLKINVIQQESVLELVNQKDEYIRILEEQRDRLQMQLNQISGNGMLPEPGSAFTTTTQTHSVYPDLPVVVEVSETTTTVMPPVSITGSVFVTPPAETVTTETVQSGSAFVTPPVETTTTETIQSDSGVVTVDVPVITTTTTGTGTVSIPLSLSSIFVIEPATNIRRTSATLNTVVSGTVDAYTATSTKGQVYFQYGLSPNNLNKISSSTAPVQGSFSQTISGLNPATRYYYRAVLKPGSSTSAYSNEYQFSKILSFVTQS